jgi:hypothetical protein
MIVLFIAGSQKSRKRGSIQWHDIHTDFHEIRLDIADNTYVYSEIMGLTDIQIFYAQK